MTKKISLNKRDFSRAILTDVLPYEVPFILTNEGLYQAINKKVTLKNEILKAIFHSRDNILTNPFNYQITKDSESNRTLYLVHPSIQIKISDLYKNYNQLITHLCTRSSYSLRHPSKIAHAYYNKDQELDIKPEEKFKDEGVSLDGEQEPIYASTFFEYKDVSFLYKFYDSYQFHRIEKKFSKLFKFDIAKCFASISTFQLSKSLRDIESYNNARGLHSFEFVFENIMNNSNLGNSHGIVVGPEFSRIYAEIILQSIDLEVKNKLKHFKSNTKNSGLIENVDYVIKRYVDDYFLFYNDEEVRTVAYKTLNEELDKYRLFCNESKNKNYSVPFITGVTIAKQQFKKSLAELFSKFGPIEESPKKMGINSPMNRYYQISNQTITDIKSIIYINNISYSSITGYYFTLARIKIAEIEYFLSDFHDSPEQCDKVTNFLLIIIEISFFVHSMDFRVRSTYLISQIIIIINRISNSLGNANSELIKKKIYDEAYSAIKSAINKSTLRDIECLNLLIAIRDIDITYQLSSETLEKIIGLDSCSTTNYFSLMTCLFYIQKKREFLSTRTKVVNCIKNKPSNHYLTIKEDSELVHIFFDSIRCPYLTDLMKNEIAKIALRTFDGITDELIDTTISIIKSRNWFIDWDISSSESIERLLMKKELKAPYGD